MMEQGYDAIILTASSTTALNTVIEEAIAEGIVVVVFDQGVTSEAPYTVYTDYIKRAQTGAMYICEQLGGEGNVIMDRGLAGAAMAQEEYEAAKAVFDSYEGINVVAEYESEYAQGPTQTGVASALTAAETIDAVWTQGPMTGVIQAFLEAGKDVPVIVGGGYGVYNGDALNMLDGGYDGMIWLSGMPGMSVVALETAYKVLNGEEVALNNTLDDLYLASNTAGEINGVTVNKLEEGVNCWRDQDASFGWPVVPTDFAIQPKIEDVFGE
jgi:ribose transport system substrate-binding protein